MRPEITRGDDGKIVKHWTTESAEAAARAERERVAARIAAQRLVRRRPALFAFIARVLKRLSACRIGIVKERL
jgi:hypothetical protein